MSFTHPSALCLRELRSLEAIAAEREAWADLVDRDLSATPFQTWEWVSGQVAYDRCRPRVLVLEEANGRWVGLVPLCERASMLPGMTQLELIGGRLSDYPGMVADPARRAECEQRFGEFLARLAGRAVALIRSQQEIPPRWLPGLPFKVLTADENVVVPLPSQVEQFMQSLSGKFRSNLSRYRRRLQDARVVFHTPANEQELRAAMPVLFHLHQMRKNSQGERGRFYETRWCEAFTDIAVSLLARAVTRLTLILIDDRPAAASFDFRLHDTQYTYQFGMDPQLRAFSPGKLLTLKMIEDAIGAGMRRYDFGRGLEDYKLQWSKERHGLNDMLMARSSTVLGAWSLVQNGYERLLRNRSLKSVYLAVRGREEHPSTGAKNWDP
jgi:CelD/BcsL family acetyltransferase involved in cellulose biosynthesis